MRRFEFDRKVLTQLCSGTRAWGTIHCRGSREEKVVSVVMTESPERGEGNPDDDIRKAVFRALNSWHGSVWSAETLSSSYEQLASVLVDELEERDTVALSKAELSELLLDIVVGMMPEWNEDNPEVLFEELAAELLVAQEVRRVEETDELEGCCLLCEREMPLTKHHLIPRAMHKEYKKRGFSNEQLCTTVDICRACHSAIHKFITLKEMAADYRTLEDLRSHDRVKSFIRWNAKQKVRLKVSRTHNRHLAQ